MIRLPIADPGIPDTRSPVRLLLWVGRLQVRTLVAGVLLRRRWMVAQALMPFAIGRAIQEGIVERTTMPSPTGRSCCSASARRRPSRA